MKKKDMAKIVPILIKWGIFGAVVVLTFLMILLNEPIMKSLEGVSAGTDADGKIIWLSRPLYLSVDEKNAVLRWICKVGLVGLVKSIQIIGMAVIIDVALHYISLIPFSSKKARTISRLIENFVKWVVAIASVFLVMAAWGADSVALLTSAGVLTLIIGLGSQSLVADILAGIFIVFEGEFQVGDIVIIEGWRGEVLEIGMRTTKLIDAGGNIKIINNSDIRSIVNQTQELSIAKCYMRVSHDMRIEKIEAIIKDNLAKVKEAIPDIVEGPFYKGVSELGVSSVVLFFVAKCKENDIYQVQRDMNRNFKIMFDDNGIHIPYEHIVVNFPTESDGSNELTKKDIRKAEAFNAEQKALSSSIEEQNATK